jgi:hypothetical protein
MPSSWIDGVSEQRANDLIYNRNKANETYRTSASPVVAAQVGQIYKANPWMTPGQVLALAKAGASPEAVELAATQQAKNTSAQLDPARPRKKSWWERNVFDNVKETARWSFAALNTAPEIAQNVASQIASPNDPAGFDGWFKSTSLGTMFADSNEAGEGWFLGGSAAEKQAERAREVRGTINGSAWTVGRGAADVFFTPGSKEYSILSGFLDAAVNVGADPTFIGGKALAGVKAGRASIKGIKTVEEIAAAKKIALVADKSFAGLTDAEKAAWDTSKFMKFFTTDSRAKRLVSLLADEKTDDPVKILFDVFDGKIDTDTALKLSQAKTTDQVLGIIAEQTAVLDDVSARALPQDIRDIRGAKWGTQYKERVPGVNSFRQSRLLTEMPENFVVHGSGADRVKAIKNYRNYLNTIKGNFTESEDGQKLMRQIFDAYSDTSKASVDSARDAFDETVKVLMLEEGVPDSLIQDIFKKVRDNINETKAYFVDEAGDATDAGFIQALIASGNIDPADFATFSPTELSQLRLHGPGSVVELLDRTHVLPDIRVVRRVTGNPVLKSMITRADGDPRAAVALSEYLQNKVWKPLTLATGGYIMRNMFDAQVRIATIGKDGFFNHPLRYIGWVMGEKGAERIVGRNFDAFIKDSAERFDDITDYYEAATKLKIGRGLDDVVPSQVRAVRNGSWKIVSQAEEPDLWVKGLRDELIQISKDSIENGVAKGIPTDDLIKYLRSDPKGKEALADIEKYLTNGVNIIKEDGWSVKSRVSVVDDDVLREWIERLAKGRVNIKTGGDTELAFAVGYRRVPLDETFSEFAKDIDPKKIKDGPSIPGKGSLVDLSKKGEGKVFAVVTDVVDTPSGPRWQLQRVSTNQFVGKGVDPEELAAGRRELTEMIKRKAPEGKLPKKVKLAEETIVKGSENPAGRALDRMTNLFFHELYEKRFVNKLERSPVYRQFYYEQVVRNVDSLTKAEASKLVTDISDAAKKLDMKPGNYVGSKDNWKKIQELAATANGTGTIKDLDDYAGLMALDSVKTALFDASSKNNLEDILRIVIPFGAAWREVLGTYAKYSLEDPTRIRRAQQMFNGLANADPDADGQGFFYKDPTTNEYSFNFPMSGTISKLLTGVNAPLQAPVKRVSIGLNVIPAIGPVGQIAASAIIPDTPTFDGVVSILLPFGRGTSASLLPSWARKLKSALVDNESQLQTIYGNTYVDVVRALSASGDYNLDDEQSKAELMEDAKGKARILASMRAIGQFIGPASPSNEFIVDTKEGDVYASALIKEFYKLQTNNYDTAVSEFIRIYGDDALLYLSSKSQATQGGLEASKEFGAWERSNEDLVQQYPEIAGYFAPGGSDFDFQTWDRQIRSGARKRLTAQEVIEQAQYRIGASQYRAYKAQVGSYPNEEQRAWLKNIRSVLNDKYPGFPVVPVFTVGEFEGNIEKMRSAVENPKLADNDVARALATYLQYRDQTIATYVASGGQPSGLGTAKAAESLRDYLSSIGQALIEQTPDFARIWERELQSEVDQ